MKAKLMIVAHGFKAYYYEIYQRSEFGHKINGILYIRTYFKLSFVLKMQWMRNLQLKYIFNS